MKKVACIFLSFLLFATASFAEELPIEPVKYRDHNGVYFIGLQPGGSDKYPLLRTLDASIYEDYLPTQFIISKDGKTDTVLYETYPNGSPFWLNQSVISGLDFEPTRFEYEWTRQYFIAAADDGKNYYSFDLANWTEKVPKQKDTVQIFDKKIVYEKATEMACIPGGGYICDTGLKADQETQLLVSSDGIYTAPVILPKGLQSMGLSKVTKKGYIAYSIVSYSEEERNQLNSQIKQAVGNGAFFEAPEYTEKYFFLPAEKAAKLAKEVPAGPIYISVKSSRIEEPYYLGFAQRPFKAGEEWMVPVRLLVESAGGTVQWEDGKIELSYDGNCVTIFENAKEGVKNGEDFSLSMSTQVVNEQTFVPLKEVVLSLGMALDQSGNEITLLVK